MDVVDARNCHATRQLSALSLSLCIARSLPLLDAFVTSQRRTALSAPPLHVHPQTRAPYRALIMYPSRARACVCFFFNTTRETRHKAGRVVSRVCQTRLSSREREREGGGSGGRGAVSINARSGCPRMPRARSDHPPVAPPRMPPVPLRVAGRSVTRKYLRNATTKFLFHRDDGVSPMVRDGVFRMEGGGGGEVCRRLLRSRDPQVTVAERVFKNTGGCDPGRMRGKRDRGTGRQRSRGMDRGLSTFSPLAPLVRTLGGPNERLCHFYMPRLALIHRARVLRPMLSLNDGCR